MLFTKENYEKIQGIIYDINDSYKTDEPETEHTYLELNRDQGRVYEIRKQFIGFTGDSLDDLSNWHPCGIKDVTLCFKAMLMYIPDND